MTRANPDETVTVELQFYAPFRDAVGEKTVALDLPAGATLGDALARVAERNPEVEGKLLDDEGEVRRGVRALRNGNERADADDRLDDGDEVSFTTPIHGG